MSTKYTNIASANNVYTNIVSQDQLTTLTSALIIDCRAKLGDASWGKEQYLAGHVPGAVYANLDTDLAAPPGSGGRHPLPSQSSWVATLRNWGLQHDQQVVLYDDALGAYAARAWWMLRWVGHENAAVLDGGLKYWTGTLETGPFDSEQDQEIQRSRFEPQQPLVTPVSVDAISIRTDRHSSGSRQLQLVDARTEARWAGEEEPIDAIAGHIPGALCMPFQDNLTPDGLFLTARQLQDRFAQLTDPIVCYCGSGVTACHNILALDIAGRSADLFVDSWSGWITDPTRPIAGRNHQS
jgi:thiosulfate/3-mercaptopyruvate sulfurtransferase